MRQVLASATEAELAALFHNGREACPLLYKVSEDWTGGRYCGLTLDWDVACFRQGSNGPQNGRISTLAPSRDDEAELWTVKFAFANHLEASNRCPEAFINLVSDCLRDLVDKCLVMPRLASIVNVFLLEFPVPGEQRLARVCVDLLQRVRGTATALGTAVDVLLSNIFYHVLHEATPAGEVIGSVRAKEPHPALAVAEEALHHSGWCQINAMSRSTDRYAKCRVDGGLLLS
jgi:hypothetical protein